MQNNFPETAQKHPTFFIVGAGKSGTTSLWHYLRQHPAVFMTENKEPGYFCHSQGIRNYEKYLKMFSGATTETALGEASHAYISSPESAAWINAIYPEMKIIAVLRNPLERAYSLYNWMRREGFEPIDSFEKALDAEPQRMGGGWLVERLPGPLQNYLYFYSGLYSEQLGRYYKAFPQKQIHILLYDDLKRDPVSTVQKVYAFLDIDASFIPETSIHNAGRIPLSPNAQFLIRKYLTYPKKLHIPGAVLFRDCVLRLNTRFGKGRPPALDAGTRIGLGARFHDDIQATGRLIGRDLSGWLQ